MLQFWNVFFLLATVVTNSPKPALGLERRHIELVSPVTTDVKLSPFQLELRSKSPSQSEGLASTDLKNFTESHIRDSIIAIRAEEEDDSIWDGFESLSLYAEVESMATMETRRRTLRTGPRRRALSKTYFSVTYSGVMSFRKNTTDLPDEEQTQNAILDAFIGQGKIDYLALVQTSQDSFLESADYAKVWIATKTTDVGNGGKNAVERNRLFLIIAIIAAITIFICVLLITFYVCCYKTENNHAPLQGSTSNKTKKLKNRGSKSVKSTKEMANGPCYDMRLTATRSESPPPSEPERTQIATKSRSKSNRQSTHNGSYPHATEKGNGNASVTSKDTIDVNGSFDMIAWKNTCLDSHTPFETDITMISKSDSPNKTIQVEIPREVRRERKSGSGSSSSSSSLSRGALIHHNSRRYAGSNNYNRHSSSSLSSSSHQRGGPSSSQHSKYGQYKYSKQQSSQRMRS